MVRPAIRKMRQEDRPAVLALLGRWNMAPVPPRAGEEAEATGLEPERTFVAVHEGRVIGVSSYVMTGADSAQTQSLAVDPAWRGRGLGERLQRARMEALRAQGIRQLRTEADRPETIAWYVRKFGYRVEGKVPKKQQRFSLPEVAEWTVLRLDL
jgi:N-acetylglutamate synthase-like GNAT family acetyltransferase